MTDEMRTGAIPLPRSPVAHLADQCAAAGSADCAALRELPLLAQVELRVDAEEAQAASRMAAEFLGCALPGPGRASGDGHPYTLWCGPGWYLVVDAAATGHGLTAGLTAALGGEYGALCGSVVDVSAQRTVLELRGPRAGAVLARGCVLDLHPRVFSPGDYAQTVLAGAAVGIHRAGEAADGPAYRILVRASYADHLVRWLLDAVAAEAADQN